MADRIEHLVVPRDLARSARRSQASGGRPTRTSAARSSSNAAWRCSPRSGARAGRRPPAAGELDPFRRSAGNACLGDRGRHAIGVLEERHHVLSQHERRTRQLLDALCGPLPLPAELREFA